MPKSRWSNPYLLVAVAFLLIAAAAMGLGYATWGVLAVVASAGFSMQASRSKRVATPRPWYEYAAPQTQQSRRRLWIALGVVVASALLAFLALYLDAVNGYHQAWPVYVFAGVGAVATIAGSFLLWKIMQ